MRSHRRGLFSLLTDLAIRFTRRDRNPDPQALQRADYRTDTRSMGVRMTSHLRDRLRRTWLRIRRDH